MTDRGGLLGSPLWGAFVPVVRGEVTTIVRISTTVLQQRKNKNKTNKIGLVWVSVFVSVSVFVVESRKERLVAFGPVHACACVEVACVHVHACACVRCACVCTCVEVACVHVWK